MFSLNIKLKPKKFVIINYTNTYHNKLCPTISILLPQTLTRILLHFANHFLSFQHLQMGPFIWRGRMYETGDIEMRQWRNNSENHHNSFVNDVADVVVVLVTK